MSQVTARTLVRNSLHMNAVQVAQMLSRLVLTPLVIARLGIEGYGVWVLLFSLCATVTALNTAVVSAYVKVTAELDARGDYRLMSEALSAGGALMGALTAALMGLVWLLSGTFLPRIGVPASLLGESISVLAILWAAGVFETGPGCSMAALAGLQRMDLQYRIKLVAVITEVSAAIVLLAVGFGMRSLAVGFLLNQAGSSIAAWFAGKRLRPQLKLSIRRASLTGLRQLVPLGFRLQRVVVLSALAREGVRLCLSTFFGPAVLGTYQLADRVLFVARFPALALAGPLMPAFSSLEAGGQAEKSRRLFVRSSTVTAVAAAVFMLFAAVFAEEILFAWTGRHFPDAAWTVRILAPAELLPLLSGVAIAALRAAGKVELELRFALMSSVLATALAVAGGTIGYTASMIALAAGRCLAALWFLVRFPATLNLERGPYLRRTVLAAIIVAAPVVFVMKRVADTLHAETRWETVALLGVLAAGSALAAALLTWVFLLAREDRVALLRREQRAG